MAEFSRLVITNKGQALIAKMIAGSGNINFTKVSASANAYTLAQLQGLTSLAQIKQTSLISKVTRTNGVTIKVEAAFTNTDLSAGYYMKALGLYAVDPDEGEILYAVTIETSGNCYMPPYNNLTVSGAYIQLVTTVGNSDNVSLQVDSAAVATIGNIQDLQNQIADLEAFVGYSDPNIVGVEVDFRNRRFTRLAGAVNRTPGAMFDNINAFGGRRRCNLKDDGTVTAYYGQPNYTTTGTFNGNPVQTMVEQPMFYYKVVPMEVESSVKGLKIRKARYYISDTEKPGFKVHPAFIRNGKVKPFIYLSAFEGSLYDVSATSYILDDAQVADFNADKLCSIANAKPISGLTQNLTRGNTRKLAQNRGVGWEQQYAATIACSQLLMLIEYASFDMQTKIGNGNVSKTDDGTSNMSEVTGATANLGNTSGAVLNANNIQMVCYRGEENIWGNIWKWVDGMNKKNPSTFASGDYGTLYVADHGFADNTDAAPYQETGIYPTYGEGYISAFGYSEKFDYLFIAVEYSGNDKLPVGDYAWNKNPSFKVARSGADWTDGLKAGASCLNLNYDSSYRHRTIGGRLVYVPNADEEVA